MLNILDHEETTSFCDDAVISEILDTDKGQFSLYREYIGGIDENGGFDLEGAWGCYISLNETTGTTGHDTIEELYRAFHDMGYDCRIDDNVIMMTAPEIKKSLVIENYDSETETINICNMIKSHFEEREGF